MKYLSVAEVARVLRLDINTVYYHISHGNLIPDRHRPIMFDERNDSLRRLMILQGLKKEIGKEKEGAGSR